MLFLFLGACLSFTCSTAASDWGDGFTYPVEVASADTVQGPYEVVALDMDGLLLGVDIIDLHAPHVIAPQLDARGEVVCRPVEYVSALTHVAASQG